MSDLQRVLDVKMRQALQDLRQLSTVPAAVGLYREQVRRAINQAQQGAEAA